MEHYPHSAHDLIASLGITDATLRALRSNHLVEGDHFKRSGRTWLYSESARLLLAESVGVAQKTAEAAMPAKLDAVVMNCQVWRVFQHGIRNTRILEAHLPGSDPFDRENLIRVQVIDNRRFLRGMLIPCKHLEGDLWVHWDEEKNCMARPPRWRGKW